MSVPDCVPTFASLTNINTQWTPQCHWHTKPKGRHPGKRCENHVTIGELQKRTTLIGTLRGLISSGTSETNFSYITASSSESLKISEITKELSELLLCKRWHRVESAAVYAKWSIELQQVRKSLSPLITVDIRKELNIDDGKMHLCRGRDSNGIRCTSLISAKNLECANAIIDVMTNCRDGSPITRDNVTLVAQLLMCQQYHQDQANEKAGEWFKRIRKLFPPAGSPPGRHLSGSQPSNVTRPSTLSQPSTSFSRRTSTPNAETPESSASNISGRANSTTTSTPITSPPSQRRCDPKGTPHGSPHLPRPVTTATNARNVEPQRVAHNRVTRSTARQYERGYLPPEPSPPEFKPFHSPNKKNTFLKDLHTKITSPLTTTQKKSGYIYGFQRKGANYIKIGYTCDSVQSRVHVWEKQCNQKLAVVLSEPIPHASKLESLVHLTLYHERRSEIGCNGCGIKHIEWFEVTLERAKHVLETWKRWIESEPYDKEGNLKPVWIKHIDKLRKDKMNSSLESWRDWIDVNMLTKDSTIKVKKETIDDMYAATPASGAKAKINVAKRDVKDEEEVKATAKIEELSRGLSRLNRTFVESIVNLKVEIPEGKPPKTYPRPMPDLPLRIDDRFPASPVTAVAV